MSGREVLVGRYELRGVLGHGGMAEVRDGWDTRLCRPVAVKLVHPTLVSQPDIRRRFADEARSAAVLEHPNIVAVHDFGDHDGTPFIVMERLPGHTLGDVMAQGPMAPQQVRAMLDDVLSALAVAHGAGVLHRDIKPGNILVSASGDRLKVGDFGIAKTGGAAATATGQIIGTMCYMSPERVAGAPASVADDLYAVGVIGYEAVTGRRAFPQDNPLAVARAIMDDPPPPLAVCCPGLDPALAAVIDRAMARDPAQRFGSADQMRAALAGGAAPRPATRVLTQAPVPLTGYPVAPVRRPRRPNTARGYLAAAAIVAAFLVSILTVAVIGRSSPPTPEPISTSTSVPAPPPTTTPSPPVPAASSTVEQPAPQPAPPKKRPGNGHGRGHGD
ncbi:serine/threonine protein kinase [Mycolicibacterium chubuense NBB4]|uniref:Serine/threonine protein kinase n=1 Tax=Mycolicibacterium chubuense (strain NBB4) TaxID=710421 RepID=I4BQ97_MYCCN|nr:serine/threonine-protein kinase [Mycolicibacterium chubuense]AFM19454.1 serine/threonine protein kinase [Mycolicibacterium chubuense NBB4]